MSRSHVEKYVEDILPAVEDYVQEHTSGFTSGEIAERLDGYSPSEVGRTLKYVVKNDMTDHVILTGNNPKTWEAVLVDSEEPLAWERLTHGLDTAEEDPPETVDVEEETERIRDKLYSVLKREREVDPSRLQIYAQGLIEERGLSSRFLGTRQKMQAAKRMVNDLRDSYGVEETRDSYRWNGWEPETLELDQVNDQLYGKLRKNRDRIISEIEDLKESGREKFRSSEIDGLVPKTAGGALVAAAALGALSYHESSGNNTYLVPSEDSIEELEEFLEHFETIEDARKALEAED